MKEFQEYDVIGYPRLVRLNPNIPWKTRGNGAVSIRLGEGVGKKFLIGEIGNEKYYGYSGFKSNDNISMNDAGKRLEKIIDKYAFFDDRNTNPAFVVMEKKPTQGLYWDAVRKIVNLNDVKKILRQNNATYHGYKNKRGLIGATSAISWRPKDKTYEIIAYREKKKIGSKRKINGKSVIKMDKKFSFTFNNYDYENKKIVIAPSSPCPVLFGIRGNKPDLIKPMEIIKSEKINRWFIFETNQGTDEHLQKKKIGNINAYESVIAKGKILSKPKTIQGGHVIFSISENNHQIDCAAYEPTKNFRNLIRELEKNDFVTVFGGVRKKPLTINIEKIKIESLADVYEKIIPSCPKCGKKMKSIGKNQGYRCRKCGIKTKKIQTKKIERKIKTGFYEVPVCARRHLSKPLKRF